VLRLNAPFLPTFGSSAKAAPTNAPGTPSTYRVVMLVFPRSSRCQVLQAVVILYFLLLIIAEESIYYEAYSQQELGYSCRLGMLIRHRTQRHGGLEGMEDKRGIMERLAQS
jgi:hypothetical protein